MALFKIGSSGQEVRHVQKMLNFLIPAQTPLQTDGIFGPKTQARSVQFQKSASLVPDGIVGPLTTKALVGQVLVGVLERK